ncbi:hypothetical protein [Brucella sp. JSBI001]|uniref:hypothetical protein n=1 Tax=Brucella sp. JSBI001 TaxID=2886044 RepID=UPI002230403D|nr:hypothetical protein [Brucella sp. JSBI001]UZD70880.1 hypothetical protein LJ361_05535 [Brucella sp. JSBI001]
MSVKISSEDYKGLKSVIGAILKWHTEGEVTTVEATGALLQMIAAAAIDKDAELKSWANEPQTLARWKSMIDNSR